MAFKLHHKFTPNYLTSLTDICVSPYQYRDNDKKVALAKLRTNYIKRSFNYSCAAL